MTQLCEFVSTIIVTNLQLLQLCGLDLHVSVFIQKDTNMIQKVKLDSTVVLLNKILLLQRLSISWKNYIFFDPGSLAGVCYNHLHRLSSQRILSCALNDYIVDTNL